MEYETRVSKPINYYKNQKLQFLENFLVMSPVGTLKYLFINYFDTEAQEKGGFLSYMYLCIFAQKILPWIRRPGCKF